MAKRTSKKSPKVGRRSPRRVNSDTAATGRAAAKAAKPRKVVAKSAVRKLTKETTRAAKRPLRSPQLRLADD